MPVCQRLASLPVETGHLGTVVFFNNDMELAAVTLGWYIAVHMLTEVGSLHAGWVNGFI